MIKIRLNNYDFIEMPLYVPDKIDSAFLIQTTW